MNAAVKLGVPARLIVTPLIACHSAFPRDLGRQQGQFCLGLGVY